MIKTVYLKDRLIEYELIRKQVKNINLRIKSDGSIYVSAGPFVSGKIIERFLISKSDFIIKALEKCNAHKSPDFNFKSGDVIKFLGTDISLCITEGKKSYYTLSDNTLVLCVKNISDIDEKKKVFNKWQKEECMNIVTSLCNKHYDHFKNYCCSLPKLTFRKMKSRWGSCNRLTFNTILIFTPIECIEYVVVHEFAHFIEHNHSRDFYKIIEEILPDYKVRRKMLKCFENKENFI